MLEEEAPRTLGGAGALHVVEIALSIGTGWHTALKSFEKYPSPGMKCSDWFLSKPSKTGHYFFFIQLHKSLE